MYFVFIFYFSGVGEQRQASKTLTISATELRDSVHEALVQLRSPAQTGLGVHGAHFTTMSQARIWQLQPLVLEGRRLVRLSVRQQRQAAILLHLVHRVTTTNAPNHRSKFYFPFPKSDFFFFFPFSLLQ